MTERARDRGGPAEGTETERPGPRPVTEGLPPAAKGRAQPKTGRRDGAGRGDGRQPLPARDAGTAGGRKSPEPVRDPADHGTVAGQVFEVDGERWLARTAGAGAGGTGRAGPAYLEAIHFFRVAEPDEPRREALLARRRLPELFDSELAALFRGATPIVRRPGGRGPT